MRPTNMDGVNFVLGHLVLAILVMQLVFLPAHIRSIKRRYKKCRDFWSSVL